MRHQIRIHKTGVDFCEGGIDFNIAQFRSSSIRVSDVKLPPLGIIRAVAAAVTDQVTNATYDLPDIISISDLVNWFDSLVKQGGGRVAYSFYGNNEFELCTDANAITLHADFAAFLKLPTVIGASTCMSAYIDPATMTPVFRGYVVTVLGHSVRGIDYPVDPVERPIAESAVAILDVDQDCSRTPKLSFLAKPLGLAVRVYIRNLDNSLTLLPIDRGDEFQVVFDVDA